MPRTMHWLPKMRAPWEIRSGLSTAALLMLIFSAPALRTRYMSSTLRIPPPTLKGMKMVRATWLTTSIMMPRLSDEAVMS